MLLSMVLLPMSEGAWGGGVLLVWGGRWRKCLSHNTCMLSPHFSSWGWSQPCHLADSVAELKVLQL